jgi:hypothetical protein
MSHKLNYQQLVAAACLVFATQHCAAQMWKCVGADGTTRYTYDKAEAKGCQLLDLQSEPPPTVAPAPKNAAPSTEQVAAFRKNLKPGDKATVGLVVEVKPPIAAVETGERVRWFTIDELMPSNRR